MPRSNRARGGGRRLVRAVGAAVLAVGAAVLPAGGPATASGPAASAGRYDAIATETLDSVVHGDFTAAAARFDPTLRGLLPPAALAAGWAAYQDELGRYRSHGGPRDTELGDLTVVDMPLRMERQAGEFRVTFHEDASIAGLFFLKAGAAAL